MTIEENKETIKRAINLIDNELVTIKRILNKSINKLNLQKHENEYDKLNELKNLFKIYLEKYSFVFSHDIDEKNVNLKIEELNKMLKISKKILNFKFRWFFYNINVYSIFENFTPEISVFLEKLDNEAIIKLNELQTYKDKNIDLKLNKEQNKTYKPMNFDYESIEFKRKEIIDQAENKEFYSHDLYSSYQTIFNNLENILNNNNNNLFEIMKSLKDAAATAIANLSIVGRTQLTSKEKQNINWIIGAYEKAYRIFEKKYDYLMKFVNNKGIEELNKINKKYNLNFNKNNYATNEMIRYSNQLIRNYMITKKEIYQKKVDNYSELKASDVLLENMWRMSLEEIRITYKALLEQYRIRSYYREFDYQTFQNNFIVAIFQILKSRKIINKNETLTNQTKNMICNEILVDTIFMETEKGKTL